MPSLSPAARALYATFVMDADAAHEVRAKRMELAAEHGLSASSLERALTRLESAGLIVRKPTRADSCRWTVRLDMEALDLPGNHSASNPVTTPRQRGPKTPGNHTASKGVGSQALQTGGEKSAAKAPTSPGLVKPQPGNHTASPQRKRSDPDQKDPPYFPSGNTPGRAHVRARVLITPETAAAGTVPPDSFVKPAPPPVLADSSPKPGWPVRHPRLGLQLLGSPAGIRRLDNLQALRDAGLIPGAVTMAVLPLTWIPKAPLLRDDATPAEDADALWAAWQTVAAHRGHRAHAAGWSRRGRNTSGRGALDQLTSVPEAALRLCAEALRSERLEPVAWVSWSWDAWAAMRGGPQRKPPPLRWVFSAQRVHERHGWCRSETGRFRTLRAERWPREAREHAERVAELHRLVVRLDPAADRDAVRAAVAAVFPKGVEASLERAQAALRAQAEAVRDDLAAGAFLWA